MHSNFNIDNMRAVGEFGDLILVAHKLIARHVLTLNVQNLSLSREPNSIVFHSQRLTKVGPLVSFSGPCLKGEVT